MISLSIARLTIIETMRRKEFYVILVLIVGLAIWMLTMNMHASGVGRFAKDIIMQVTWLASFGLAAPLAARQIVSDLEQKTIYVLMSRPIPRWHYVFGRALGSAGASVLCFTAMFLVLIAMLLLKGAGDIIDVSLWQAYILQVVALVMFSAIAVFFSTLGTSAGAVTFSLLIFVTMRYGALSILGSIEHASLGLANLLWIFYLILPHFEFFSLTQRVVHGWGPLPITVFLQILGYGIAYSIATTALAALVFRKRWI